MKRFKIALVIGATLAVLVGGSLVSAAVGNQAIAARPPVYGGPGTSFLSAIPPVSRGYAGWNPGFVALPPITTGNGGGGRLVWMPPVSGGHGSSFL